MVVVVYVAEPRQTPVPGGKPIALRRSPRSPGEKEKREKALATEENLKPRIQVYAKFSVFLQSLRLRHSDICKCRGVWSD
jgi:hypothetical protein